MSVSKFEEEDNFDATWNSSIPVETIFCWSTDESPRSAASLSSLNRALGYSLEHVWGPSFSYIFLAAYFWRLFFDLDNKESSSLGNKERSLFHIGGPSDKCGQHPIDGQYITGDTRDVREDKHWIITCSVFGWQTDRPRLQDFQILNFRGRKSIVESWWQMWKGLKLWELASFRWDCKPMLKGSLRGKQDWRRNWRLKTLERSFSLSVEILLWFWFLTDHQRVAKWMAVDWSRVRKRKDWFRREGEWGKQRLGKPWQTRGEHQGGAGGRIALAMSNKHWMVHLSVESLQKLPLTLFVMSHLFFKREWLFVLTFLCQYN